MTAILFIDGGGPVEVEFMGVYAALAVPIVIDFGDAVSGRKIIVAVHLVTPSGVDQQIDGGTIGGVAASVFVGDNFTPGGASPGDNGVWWIGAEVPSGTSGTIIPTSGGVGAGNTLGVWRMVNAISLPATDTDVATFNTASAVTVNADGLSGGAYFAAATAFHNTGDITLSGLTPDYNQDITSGGTSTRITGGFALLPSDVSGQAATLTPGGGLSMLGALAAVSFR